LHGSVNFLQLLGAAATSDHLSHFGGDFSVPPMSPLLFTDEPTNRVTAGIGLEAIDADFEPSRKLYPCEGGSRHQLHHRVHLLGLDEVVADGIANQIRRGVQLQLIASF